MHDVHRCRTGNCTGNGIVDIGADAKTVGIDDIFPLVAGAVNKEVMQDGAIVAGHIHDIPTCKELIDRIMTEAEIVIRARLEGFLSA